VYHSPELPKLVEGMSVTVQVGVPLTLVTGLVTSKTCRKQEHILCLELLQYFLICWLIALKLMDAQSLV
jgi:hypothetical protein